MTVTRRFSDWLSGKYLLTHDSDARDLVIGCLVKYLLTHDSDAERFSDWLSG